MHVKQTQDNNNYNTHNINDRFIKSISDDETIKRKKQFSLIKFSHEKVLST